MTVSVRTVFKPDQVLEVDEAEAEALRRQGLLAEETDAPPASEEVDTPPAASASTPVTAKPAAAAVSAPTVPAVKEATDGSK